MGLPWGMHPLKGALRWDDKKRTWTETGLKDVRDIVAGPEGHVYALALP